MTSCQNQFSKSKSFNTTMRQTSTPIQLRQESSILSLNIEDLRTLMKRKEKEYQQQLLIDDAKRVHNFLTDMQEQQKMKIKNNATECRRQLKQSIHHYSTQTVMQFQNQWKANLEQTVKQLEELEQLAQKQHQKEVQIALDQIEKIKNGKGLQKIRFSREALEAEDQLRRLAKAQRYEQAQVVNKRLQSRKKQQMKRYIQSSIDKQRKSFERLKKRHQKQKQLLGAKLTKIYIEEQQKQMKQIQKLVRNMRTYEIDSLKIESKVNRLSRAKENSSRTPTPTPRKETVLEYSIAKSDGIKEFNTVQVNDIAK